MASDITEIRRLRDRYRDHHATAIREASESLSDIEDLFDRIADDPLSIHELSAREGAAVIRCVCLAVTFFRHVHADEQAERAAASTN